MAKVMVSADKAFEMEFLFAREAIRVRMDYNRRLLAGQVTLVAALIAGALTLGSRDTLPNSVLLQGTAAVILWLNTAFLFENTSNNSHISVAAVFMHNIINSKYGILGSVSAVYEWESFLSLDRQHSSSTLKRNFFLLDSAFVLNVMFTVIGCLCFYVATEFPGFHLSRIAVSIFVPGVVAAAAAYVGHFKSNSDWKLLVTEDERRQLLRTYTLPAASKTEAAEPIAPAQHPNADLNRPPT